jgi:hypothetical protein
MTYLIFNYSDVSGLDGVITENAQKPLIFGCLSVIVAEAGLEHATSRL